MPALTGPNPPQSRTPGCWARAGARYSPPALQRLHGPARITTTEMDLNLSPEEVMREFQQK
jgi:hypothetical protein